MRAVTVTIQRVCSGVVAPVEKVSLELRYASVLESRVVELDAGIEHHDRGAGSVDPELIGLISPDVGKALDERAAPPHVGVDGGDLREPGHRLQQRVVVHLDQEPGNVLVAVANSRVRIPLEDLEDTVLHASDLLSKLGCSISRPRERPVETLRPHVDQDDGAAVVRDLLLQRGPEIRGARAVDAGRSRVGGIDGIRQRSTQPAERKHHQDASCET